MRRGTQHNTNATKMDSSCTDLWKLLHGVACLARSAHHTDRSFYFPADFPVDYAFITTHGSREIVVVACRGPALKSERANVIREALRDSPSSDFLGVAEPVLTTGFDMHWHFRKRRMMLCIQETVTNGDIRKELKLENIR